MKNVQFSLLALLLYTACLDAKVYKKNVSTYEIGPGAKINGNTITYEEPGCDDDLDCTTTKTCSKAGYSPSLSEGKKYFACCADGQQLLGSPNTAFDCCADGHDLVGDSHCGYHCCPTGFTFDGKQCKEFCKNGRALVDGKCVCPKGTTESSDGTCEKTPDEPGKCDDGECSSGLKSGKCYIFKADNGNRLGLASDNVYYAAAESMTQRYGKFQLCVDEKCAPGKAINPSTEVYIRDTYGDLATGANKNQWLIHAVNGGHIGRTPIFSTAGHFSISKWPCGKYCLGGFTEGVGPACPATTPALTFYTQDPQMCVEFEFTEVPCDLKSDANNCIWKSGEQCCNKVDCSKPDCSNKENESNSSITVSSDNISAGSALLEDTLPEGITSDDISLDTASSDHVSPGTNSLDDSSPDSSTSRNSSSNWGIPLSYNTTFSLAAVSLILSAILFRLPKEKIAQFAPPINNVAQVPAPKENATQVVTPEDSASRIVGPLAPESDVVEVKPEDEDIDRPSRETRRVVSGYATAALSRYTTKSRTVVSTSRINHDETSSQVEIESTNTTPEELEL